MWLKIFIPNSTELFQFFSLGNILKNPASEIKDVSVNTGKVFTSTTVAPGDNTGQNWLVVNNADKWSTRVT